MGINKIGVVVLLVVLGLVLGKKSLKEEGREKEDKTVVEANHFYSNYERNTTYEINSVQKNKSLIFLLKHGEQKSKQLKDNPITISLISGQITQTCTFHSYHNMCGINRVEETLMKLKIECKKTPCELSWIIYQPSVLTEDGNSEIERFVAVNQDYNHATIVLSCNDPNIKTFGKDIQLYTNSEYQRVQTGGLVYYLFDNEQKGYYFLTTQNDGARKCGRAVMRHSKDSVEFNKDGNILQDFLLPNKSNQYTFAKLPQFDLRIDGFFSVAKGNDLSQKEGLVISLIGENGTKKTTLSSVTITGEKKTILDFSAVFKRPTEKYDTFVFEVKSTGKEILVYSISYASSQRQQVNLGENSYFQLKKGEVINFKLVPEAEQTDDSRLTHIFSSNESLFLPTVKDCKTKAGCEFNVEAKEAGDGSIYLGGQAEKNQSQIPYIDFKRSITRKMRGGDLLYLKTTLKAKEVVQAVVNSPNVIIYLARKDSCPVVSSECHDKVFNYHNPAIYQPPVDTEVVILAQALDNCEFTLTLLEQGQEYVQLHDSQPFSYLFDNSEKELLFRFKLKNKTDAHFNLIGPIDQLTLSVFNRKEVEEGSQGEVSTDGYITFAKDNIDGLTFVVKVQKREAYLQKFIHFTLLVSTIQGNVRLEPGLAQFETIPADQTRDFVFEYQPGKDTLLNFYAHNIKGQVNVLVQLSTTDDYAKDSQIDEYTLSTESDVVDIKEAGKKLCKEEAGENCELFVRLTNKMEVLIDLTLTLLVKDTIIELKDGLWNSYQLNSVAETSNFYFLPKNKNRSITLLYKSDFVDLKLMYTLWKSDDKSINPAEWPFPSDYKGPAGSLTYTPTKFAHIEAEALEKCWPNCVLLISTFKDEKSLKSIYGSFLHSSQLKIMASSNYIEVPQKHRVDVILKKDQTKHLLIDLRYALDKEAVTIFTYFTIGSVQLSANVYEESNPRCPTGDDPTDFRFGNLQTQIAVTSIKSRLEENGMNLDKNPYICILAQAYLDSKFSIEYVTDDGIIKQLMLDNFYTQRSQAGKSTYFQIDGTQEFTVKVTRTEGFPFFAHTICKSGEDYEECFEKFKADEKDDIQLADKMTAFSQEPCENCIVFLRLRSPEPSQVNIHLQSKYAETELIENQLLTDQLEAKGENKYLLTGLRNEEVIINIQILHGDLQVTLHDFDTLNHTKKNTKGSTNIHIILPTKEIKKQENNFGYTFMGLFDYSSFRSIHMNIKSQNESATALYTITYSSGDPQIFLQDGLISEYGLLPDQPTKFLYKNPTLSKIYLHISMQDATMLNKLKVKILALLDETDQTTGTEIIPQKPNFKKKTPSPTMVMALPANRLFQIQLTNPDKSFQLVTIGLNNREIIYLPLNNEFPVKLEKGEYIYLVINVPFETHLAVQVKKCDESVLALAYTTNYEDFVKEQFSYEQEMGQEELISELLIKTKASGSAYIKVKSPDDDDSLLTVKAFYSFTRGKGEKVKAGNKGLIQYKMLDSEKAELSFSPLICPSSSKNCAKEFVYSSIASTKAQDIYAQLVCSSISFDLTDRQIIHQVEPTPITSSPSRDNKIVFTHVVKESNQFVGVKAVNNKTNQIIYYRPLEISTIWGQISKQGKGHSAIVISFLGALLICCLMLICYRRKMRNPASEYAPLSGMQ